MKHKLIDTSTAAYPTGLPTQKKIFRQPVGAFAGRVLLVYARTPSRLAVTWADAPYTSWNAPADFVTDADDSPFSAVMDGGGNLHLFYTQSGSGALLCTKLTYVNGGWAPQVPVTVYDSGTSANKYPSAIRDSYNRLWVVWTRDDGGTITLRAKYSMDDGATFGLGAGDVGSDMSGSVSSAFGFLIARPTHVHCLYSVSGTALRHRSIHVDAGIWSAAEVLYTGTGVASDFGGAVAPDGRLGVLFAADSRLYLKEYDGAIWGALQTVVAQAVSGPSLRYLDLAPYALFLQPVGTDQKRLCESHRSGSSFTTPVALLSQQTVLATVLGFDADAPAAFADLTTAAASEMGADVSHPTSGGVLQSIGDAVYLGSDDRFSLIRILLSQIGVNGVVAWSYWNGHEWAAFVPASGSYHFDSPNRGVRLFSDGNSAPADWQKTGVNGANRYWVRALCTIAFTTAPIGSQITAAPKLTSLVLVAA
jgi:hypothetical protein